MRILAHTIFGFIALLLWALASIGLVVLAGLPKSFFFLLFLTLPVACWFVLRRNTYFIVCALIGFAVMWAWRASLRPSHDRAWWPETSIMPEITVASNMVTIINLRDFDRGNCDDFVARWTTNTYDLDRLESINFIIEPLGGSDLMAHTMVSFNFAGQGRVVVSIEARKEIGEDYSGIDGAFHQFELFYVFATEPDTFVVRACCRDVPLYVLQLRPARVPPAEVRSIFLELVRAADELREQPRFYETIKFNCTTTLIRHIANALGRPFKYELSNLLPALTGNWLYDHGVIDTDTSYAETLQHYNLSKRICQYQGRPDFSEVIRRDAGDQ
jgi:hypothetical protein